MLANANLLLVQKMMRRQSICREYFMSVSFQSHVSRRATVAADGDLLAVDSTIM